MTVVLNTGAAVDTTSTPAPEGHDAAMAAKVDAGTNVSAPATPATPAADRPAWLPEKFASAEDFAKAYGELEKKLGAPKVETPAAPASTEIPATPDAARSQVENAGLDFDALSAEFNKDGKLSEATYEKLAKGGINKTVVDQYVAGQQALASQIRTDVFTAAGGEEAYTDMVTWAKDSLSAAEVEAYNATMNSGNVASMKLAVDGLKARFTAANGSAPSLVGGGSSRSNAAQGDVFRSVAELTTAMKDPRYSTDPAYRADVTAKLGRSNIM
jgi:hypothetical protein